MRAASFGTRQLPPCVKVRGVRTASPRILASAEAIKNPEKSTASRSMVGFPVRPHSTFPCAHRRSSYDSATGNHRLNPWDQSPGSIKSHSTMTSPAADNIDDDDDEKGGPTGDLFRAEVGPDLVGKSASIRRTFGPRSNAQAMLTCGGHALARHASFDPRYDRARDWIRHHPVGPAVLSPVLISGLVGALVEASVPQSVPVGSSMRQIRPLIVGVEMEARITVVGVEAKDPSPSTGNREREPQAAGKNVAGSAQDDAFQRRQHGYEVELRTEARRVRDSAIIAEGSHTIWVPDYMHF